MKRYSVLYPVLVASAALAAGAVSAAPTLSYIGANRACEVGENWGFGMRTNEFHTLGQLGSTGWYTKAGGNSSAINSNSRFAASAVGYTTVWKTYAEDTVPKLPASNHDPKYATHTLATGPELALASCYDGLVAGPLGYTILYIVFSPNVYRLGYDLDSGAWPAKFTPPSTAAYDTAFTLANPAKAGHTFAGWTVDGASHPWTAGTSMTFSNLTTVAGTNVAFAARWSVNSYNLRLVVNEGVSNICYRTLDSNWVWSPWRSVTKTSAIAVPYGAQWEAYCTVSRHWTYSGTGSGDANPASGTMGAGDVTFGPEPSRKTYGLTVRSNPAAGGTTKGDGSYESESDASVEATASTGWHFVSWSDGSPNASHSIRVLCDTNLVANFEKNAYTVTFSYRDADGDLKTEKQSVAYGESAREPGSALRNGYTGHVFESWNDNGWGTITGNLNVDATYKANSYTVRFAGNGATSGTMQSQSFAYDEEKELAANLFARTGYEFCGWSTTPSGPSDYVDRKLVRNIVNAADGTPLDSGATLVLYAQWTPHTYTISFDGNGAGGAMSDLKVAYDAPVALPACAFSSDQAFVSWTCSSDGRTYADGETVVRLAAQADAVVTMTANWGQAAVVSFDGNGGEGTMERQTFTKGVEFSLSPNAFAKAGHAFAGWLAGDGRILPDRALVTTNESFSLTAVWRPNAYQISFDSGLGSGTMSPVNATYGSPATVACAFDEPAGGGYSFAGWSTNASAEVADFRPQAGTTVCDLPDLTDLPNDHIRLTAVWTRECGPWSEALGCTNLKFYETNEKVTKFVAWFPTTNDCVNVKCCGERKGQTLDASLVTNGTLTFDWRPEVADGQTATLRVILSDGTIFTSGVSRGTSFDLVARASGVSPNDWHSVTCDFAVVTSEALLKFQCPLVDEDQFVSLRNLRWMPAGSTVSHDVAFDLTEKGARIGGGRTNQTVVAGRCAHEPTVAPVPGWTLAGWTVEGAEAPVPVDAVALRAIDGPTRFTAVYTQTEYRVVYANAKGCENPNPATYSNSTAVTFAPLRNAEGFVRWSPPGIAEGTTGCVVATAVWADAGPETNTVQFVTIADGVTVTNEVAVESGKNAVAPTPAARAGYAFVGWDKSADAVSSDRTLTAQYAKIEYAISYRNTHGLVNGNSTYRNLPFSYTVEDAVTLDNLIPEAASDDVFLGWSLDGGVSLTNGLAKGSTGEKAFTAVWREATPEIVIGGVSDKVAHGTTMTVEAPFASVTNGLTNVVCVGWVGSGSVPASGTDTRVTFTVTERSTLDWLYRTNFWVSVQAKKSGLGSGAGGSVALEDAAGPVANPGWHAVGTNLVATAEPATGWTLVRWEGAPAGQSGDRTIAFGVLSPVSLTAVFSPLPDPSVTVSVAAGCETRGTVSGGRKSAKPGTKVTIRATAKTGFAFAGWRPAGDGAAPFVSQAASYTFAMPATNVAYEAEFIAKSADWVRIAVDGIESEYAPKVEIAPIAVTATGGSLPTVKATGLPAGLSLRNGVISGKPARSGVFAAKLTATTAGKATASTNVAFVVRAAGEYVVTADAEHGKATGQGVYAALKKVTLRATADKGYVFSGWYGELPSPVSRLASYAFAMPAGDVALAALFITAAEDAACVSARVNGLDLVEPGTPGTGALVHTVVTNVPAGVYLEWPVAAEAASAATVAVSGLPSGLKFTAKPITAKVSSKIGGRTVTTLVTNVPAMTIYGTPTAASKVSAKTGELVRSQVKVTVTTAGRSKSTGIVSLAVDALPVRLVGAYAGGSTNGPAGSASVTLAATGRISGKWISEGLTWTLSATGFTSAESSPDLVYAATNVTAKCGRDVRAVTLAFAVNDLGYGEVEAYGSGESDPLFTAACVPWKTDAGLKLLAAQLKNKTFAAVPADGVALTGKVGANGTVSVAGAFDTGAAQPYRATVTSTLVPLDEACTRFELFLHYPPKANRFGGYAVRLVLVWDGESLSVEPFVI